MTLAVQHTNLKTNFNYLGFRLANHPLTRVVFKTPWIGLFPNYQEALHAIPPGSPIGYDRQRTHEIFVNYPVYRVRPTDYAASLHLSRILHPGSRVLDVGGNIGMACYIAARYFPLPSHVDWILCDVPAVLETAKEVAAREKLFIDTFQYVSEIEAAGACDVFLSSGTLQFLELPLPALLRKMPELPDSVLINRIPVWDRDTCATIHDNGFCISPYHIFNQEEFVSSVEELGYRLVDDWECPESSLSIRFRPHIRINSYHGFFFSLRDKPQGEAS